MRNQIVEHYPMSPPLAPILPNRWHANDSLSNKHKADQLCSRHIWSLEFFKINKWIKSSAKHGCAFSTALGMGASSPVYPRTDENWVPHENLVQRLARTGLSTFDTAATERHVIRSHKWNRNTTRPVKCQIWKRQIALAGTEPSHHTPYNKHRVGGFWEKKESEDPVITNRSLAKMATSIKSLVAARMVNPLGNQTKCTYIYI